MSKYELSTPYSVSGKIGIPDGIGLTQEDHDWLWDQARCGGFDGTYVELDITPDPNLRTQIWNI